MTDLDALDPTELTDQIEPPAVAAPLATLGALPGRPLRERFGRLTYALCALLVGAAVFYAGARTERSALSTSTGTPSGLPAGFAAGARPAGAPAGVAGGAPPAGASRTGGSASGAGTDFGGGTTGTVKLVDGDFVYIEQSDGTIVKTAITPASTITLTTTGTVAQLHPGDTVTVSGAAGADGTINATTVRDQGASGTNPISSTASSSASSSSGGAAGAGPGGPGGGPPGG